MVTLTLQIVRGQRLVSLGRDLAKLAPFLLDGLDLYANLVVLGLLQFVVKPRVFVARQAVMVWILDRQGARLEHKVPGKETAVARILVQHRDRTRLAVQVLAAARVIPLRDLVEGREAGAAGRTALVLFEPFKGRRPAGRRTPRRIAAADHAGAAHAHAIGTSIVASNEYLYNLTL